MADESKLQRSETHVDAFMEGTVYIQPELPSRDKILVAAHLKTRGDVFVVRRLTFSPEEAYYFGQALMEHAEACGYDADTGETHDVAGDNGQHDAEVEEPPDPAEPES